MIYDPGSVSTTRGMSHLDTPLSTTMDAGGITPLSALTPLSSFSTPQSLRNSTTATRHIASPSPFPSTSRKATSQSAQILSMYSTQDRVILDIGARFIRAGFSGEAFPRCAIDALSKSDKEVFWEEGGWDPGLVEDRLERGIREVYSQYFPTPQGFPCTNIFGADEGRYLLIDSKSRKVIVSEGTLLPYRIKEAICRVLFTYFQVPSITFLNSHVLALVSTGMRTGIVVDIGWHETRILPVSRQIPFFRSNCWRSTSYGR